MNPAVGKLATIDVIIIAFYLVGITVLGSWIGRFIKDDKDFFLGGRNLPWWAIGKFLNNGRTQGSAPAGFTAFCE